MTHRAASLRGRGLVGALHPHWLLFAALLLAVLLPVQGIALSLQQMWSPAHVHRHDGAGASGAARTRALVAARIALVDAGSSANARPPAQAALADDSVLEILPRAGVTHRHDANGGDITTDMATADIAHREVEHHLHVVGDPDVVYIDDGADPDKAAAGIARLLSDGMTMLQPAWPVPIIGRRGSRELYELRSIFVTRDTAPLDRPPA